MADFESMPVLLYKMKAAELQAESSRKEINKALQEYAKIKDEIKTPSGQKQNELEATNNRLHDRFQEQKFDWEYLGTKEIMLQQILPETQQVSEKEKVMLEDIQFMVWQKRQDFCDNVLEFSNNNGLLSAPKLPQVQIQVEEPAIDPELCAVESDVTTLETSYQNLELELIAEETQQDVAKQEICLLKNEASVGKEFVRLQEALKFSQEQSKVIEVEYESSQQSFFKNYQHQGGTSKTRPQSFSFKEVTQQSKRPSSVSKNSSFRRLQHHREYEADQSDENIALEEDCDVPRPLGVKLSGQLNRQSSTSPWTGGEITSMSAEEDQQLLATKMSTSGTDNSRWQLYEQQSSSRMNINLNQGEKRSFIPKTPSAISKKLMLKKDHCLLLEKDFCAMLVSPTKAGFRESNSNKLQSDTHLQQGRNSLVNLSSDQHGKPTKMEENQHVRKEKPRNTFKPYIT